MQSVPISDAAWGIVLGVPFSFGLAAIASTIRWKGAKYVLAEPKPNPPNTPAQDEDEVENALWAVKAEEVEEEKKKQQQKKQRRKELCILLGVYAVIGGVSYGLQFIPAWMQELYMVIILSMPTAVLGSVTLCDVTGFSKCRMARTSEGVLRAWDEYSNKATLLFAPFMVACVVSVAYLENMPSALQIAIYTIFTALIPFRMSILFNGTKKDSTALKWVLFGYTAMITAVCALVAVISGVVYVVVEYGLWAKVFGESEPSEPKPEREQMRPSVIQNALPIQVSMFIGMIGVVVSQLYRIDFTLAERKAAGGAVRLEGATDAVQSLYTKDTEKHSSEDKRPENERVSSWMVLPSYISLLKTGNIKHYLVRPRYSLLGLLTMQGLVLGLPHTFTYLANRFDPNAAQNAKGINEFASSVSPTVACFLAPYALVLVIGAASLANGEARFVFNYQADWKVPVEKAEREDASQALLSEKVEVAEEEK